MRLLACLTSLALSACATAAPLPVNPPASAPNAAPGARVSPDGDAIAIALSGGGARAASFSLGALQGLRDARGADGRPLTDEIAMVTSVSGGSIMAAYFVQHGAPGLDTFRAAYLDKDWDQQLNTSPLSPRNWLGAARGAVNDQRLLADWLDAEVFSGARMAALAQGPVLSLNAADLFNGVPFAFTPATFDALCSNLAEVRVGDAVAASMAVPVVFAPVLIEPRRQACAPQPAWITQAPNDRAAPALVRSAALALASYRETMPYVHLVDGGLIDNLGLSSWVLSRLTAGNAYAPFSPQDAVRLRRFTAFVVNAEGVPDATWNANAQSPSGAAVIDRSYDIVIEAANRASYDNFRNMLTDWRRDLIAWRCALSAAEAQALGAPSGWRCDALTMQADMIRFADLDEPARTEIGGAPTRVTLPSAQVDQLIASGRVLMERNAMAQSLTRPPVE
ncbi:lipoprotein [alpha proteobacterium U9-1i]|nr:lipoprotein [alpha proteobacterium U9-1i]